MMKIQLFSLLILLVAACTSCSDSQYHAQLLLAEEQVTQSADSCARLLADIPVDELKGEDRALHGLLSSWLLYRQYAQEIPAEPLEQAYDYFRTSKDPLRRAQAYFLHAVISKDQNRGQVSQWMEDLYSACLAIEQTDDYLLASQIYQNYSSKLSEVCRFDEARVWIDKFVDAAQQCGHTGEYVQALIFKANNCLYAEEERVKREYNTMDGNVVAQHTQFDEAFATIYQALRIAQEHQLQTACGRIYTQLSIYHSRCQRLDSLLHYARLSTQLNEQLYAQGRRKELPHYITLAEAHRKLGNADSAIYYARRTFDTPGMPLRNKRVAAQMLYNVYSELKSEYHTSLEWMRVFNLLGDSINQQTIATNIEAVQDAAVKEQEKTRLQEVNRHTMGWLFWSVIIGLLAITIISCHMLRNRRRYRRHLQEQEDEFNRRIAEMRAAAHTVKPAGAPHVAANDPHEATGIHHDAASASLQADSAPQEAHYEPEPETDPESKTGPVAPQPQPEAKVVLTGSTKDQVEVLAASILFLTSESNYVKVLHLDANGKVQSKMIRQTMNNVEAQLNAYPYIIRCHRAFIVNLRHVRSASTASSGLQLTLDATSLPVPVSKTYLSLVRASLG